MLKKNKFYWLALIFIFFNIWHSAIRGIWNHSIFDALTIGNHTLELAKKSDPRIKPWKSYDGQFFYAITFDPLLLSKKFVKYIDDPLYRYRRVLYPFFAHVSALGKPLLYPITLFSINIIAWISIIFWLWKIAKMEKIKWFWLCFGGFFTTGLTYSTFRTLSETLMVSFILCGLFLWKKRLIYSAGIIFALATLTRETALLVPLTIFIYSFLKKEKKLKKLLAFIFISTIIPISWWSYLFIRLPEFNHSDFGRLTIPFLGILREGWISFQQDTSLTEHVRSLSIIGFTIPLVLFIFFYFRKQPTFWGSLSFSQAIFCSTMKGDIWNYHASSARVIILLTIFSILWFLEIDQKNSNPTLQSYCAPKSETRKIT